MKEGHNLKRVMDEQLKEVKITLELKEKIKGRCLGDNQGTNYKKYEYLVKVAVWFVAITLCLSGTGIALGQFDGFKNFIDESILEWISPQIQTINEEDFESNVRMVVEEAIMDSYNSLMVFSFINEGEKDWPKDITAGDWKESWIAMSGYGPPILSEDGRKLTYYVEGFSGKNIFNNKTLKIKAKNLIREEERQEEVDIPLVELYERYGTNIEVDEYNFEWKDKAYKKLKRRMQVRKETAEKLPTVILKEEPKVSLEYVGLLTDQTPEDPNNPWGGLVIYTKNDSYNYFTRHNSDYTAGVITEIIDIRTGETYTSREWRMEEVPMGGAVGISVFSEIKDAEQIPYLKATKVTYLEQEVVVKDKWEVEFNVQRDPSIQSLQTQIKLEEGDEWVSIEDIEISTLGVTLKGVAYTPYKDINRETLSDKMEIVLGVKDGKEIKVPPAQASFEYDKKDNQFFTRGYQLDVDGSSKGFIDVKNIEYIKINDEKIDLQ